jgi:hypothetical protein
MKKIYTFFCCISIIAISQNTIAQCTPAYGTGCSFGDRIEFFSLKGENSTVVYNQSGTTCNSSPLAFSNFTALTPVELAIGKSFSGKIFTSGSNNFATIWIDFNDNNTFEDNERLLHNLALTQIEYTAYSIFIPISSSLGLHRMRVRVVYTATPNTLTDPCDFFTWGETEDYTVNIINTPSVATVANGVAGSCYTSCATTINAASNNSNQNNISLIDTNNHYIAGIYPLGNNLGRVTASMYINNGAIRSYANGVYYLDRNITITPQTAPASPYSARLYYRNAELNALIAQPGSGVTSQFDLATTNRNEGCLSTAGASAGGSIIFPTGFGSLSGERFLDFTGLTTTGSFYFHGGSTPLPTNLLQFTAIRKSNTVVLNWKMTEAANIVFFELEKSTNGKDFNAISGMSANTTNQYLYVDNYNANEDAYYRLQLIGADETKKYSDVRMIKKQSALQVTVYPNPVKDNLQVMINAFENDNLTLLINDVTGKVLISKTIKVVNANNAIQIDVASLSNGTYFIRLLGNKTQLTTTFIKQ